MLKIIESLSRATNWDEYRSAKRDAARLDVVVQLASVDSFIAARRRLESTIGRES